MPDRKRFVVSHAPFLHDGGGIPERNLHTMLAALPAVLFGIYTYGAGALGVTAFCVATAVFWEYLFNRVAKRPQTIGDYNAALIGLVFAMLLPANIPWWLLFFGTFLCIVIGKQIFGGIGGNPFHPVALAMAMIMLSWSHRIDFNEALVNHELEFVVVYPLTAVKHFGTQAVHGFTTGGLFFGQQSGGVGATFGAGLLLGGLYLMARGFVRWEISLSFIFGVLATAAVFQQVNPEQYANPLFHLLTGYTLVGAFFLLPEDSSSPVNFIPMLIYGFAAGFITVLIRNIGSYYDGVVLAVLLVNIINPLIDKIRPKALGKVSHYA